jgi:PHD/YefM family antitoxin component YafN of YafNO toxin-antitoxin module
MSNMTPIAVQENFNVILDSVINHGESVSIATDDGAAILINQEEWDGMVETLYLQSIPGMKESLMKGKATPVSECLDSIGWDIN